MRIWNELYSLLLIVAWVLLGCISRLPSGRADGQTYIDGHWIMSGYYTNVYSTPLDSGCHVCTLVNMWHGFSQSGGQERQRSRWGEVEEEEETAQGQEYERRRRRRKRRSEIEKEMSTFTRLFRLPSDRFTQFRLFLSHITWSWHRSRFRRRLSSPSVHACSASIFWLNSFRG